MLGPPGAGKGTQAERLAKLAGSAEDLDRGHPARGRAGRDRAREGRQGDDGGRQPGRRRRHDWHRPGAAEQAATRGRGSFSTAFRGRLSRPRRWIGIVDGRGPLSSSTLSCQRTCWCGGSRHGGSAASAVRTRRSSGLASCGKCGGALVARVDDNVNIVRERLKIYQRQTKPLVDYYSARSTFRPDRRQPAAERGYRSD